jgi:hypothetical protein
MNLALFRGFDVLDGLQPQGVSFLGPTLKGVAFNLGERAQKNGPIVLA